MSPRINGLGAGNMPIDDKDRSKTILTNADNLLALTEKTE